MRKAILLASLIFIGLTAKSQSANRVLWGPNYMYSLNTPTGWIIDEEAGSTDSLDAVIYPQGYTYKDAKVTMSLQFVALPDTVTLPIYIAADNQSYTLRTTGKTKYSHEVSYNITSFFRLYTRESKKDKVVSYESVAYATAKGGIATITLRTKDKKLYAQHKETLNDMIKTFAWLTDKLELQTED